MSVISNDNKISDLSFPTRLLNSFKRANIETIGELLSFSDQELLQINGIGNESLELIHRTFRDLGIVDTYKPLYDMVLDVDAGEFDRLRRRTQKYFIIPEERSITVGNIIRFRDDAGNEKSLTVRHITHGHDGLKKGFMIMGF